MQIPHWTADSQGRMILKTENGAIWIRRCSGHLIWCRTAIDLGGPSGDQDKDLDQDPCRDQSSLVVQGRQALNYLQMLEDHSWRAWCHVPSQIRGQCSEKVTVSCPNTAPWEWCVSAHRTTEDPTSNAGENFRTGPTMCRHDTGKHQDYLRLVWAAQTHLSLQSQPTCK